MRTKFYSLKRILAKDCVYNVIIGQRSNGKTYSVLKYAIEQWAKNGTQLAYVRRFQTDIKGRRASDIFAALNADGVIDKATDGKYQGISYYGGKFYACTYDETGKPITNQSDVIGYCFSLSDNEHNKSISYPKIETILFDEFLSNYYLDNEFMLFMNTLSTIIRQRTTPKIFMLGNTISTYSPYFKEMGLTHVKEQEQGTIEVYTYGNSDLRVAVEYCHEIQLKNSKTYYAFDNSRLAMLTSGKWELDIFPHVPVKYTQKDIKYTYFFSFDEEVFQAEIIRVEKMLFTYIHRKTTPIKDEDRDLVYSLDYVPKMNYSRNIFKPTCAIQQKILWFFTHDRVFYQDNFVGNKITNMLKVMGG